MILPDYFEIERKLGNGEKIDPVEEFIHDNDVAGEKESVEFMTALEKALEYFKENY